jgi:Flp pilus assembly protein TadD
MNPLRNVLLPVLTAALFGCAPEDQRTDTVSGRAGEDIRATLSPEALAQLDSGNTAYRDRELDRAARHYRRLTEIEEDLAAGWFGLYMTETQRGNLEAADSAFERAQDLAPGASLLRPRRDGNDP